MRPRVVALLAAVVVLTGVITWVALKGGQDSETAGGQVAPAVSPQLSYLDPRSSAVVAVDMRYGEENWSHVRTIASRLLRELRDEQDGNLSQLPPNLSGALNTLTGFAGLSFEKDVEPVLDGYLTLGVALPAKKPAEPRTVVVYRTPGGDLSKIVRKVLDGDAPKALPGYDDVRLLESGTALIGDDTLVSAFGGDAGADTGRGASSELRRALDRAKAGRGYPSARLARAQRQAGSADPFVLAAGDLTLGRVLAEEPALKRAESKVPYLSAVRGIAGAVDLDRERATGLLRVATDARKLKDADLPVAPAGRVELPVTPLVAGASRDQSATTTFAARVARELFAGSRFVKAVDRAERELGIRFEDEVLRQFDCPSVSVFDAPRRLFGARSCLRDPKRMRALLPRLVPHLPRILTALQGLGDEGLLALLLVAPDAPATPSLPLAAIDVKPPPKKAGPQRELLYEITGLRDNLDSRLAQSGPERVVFGMIGDRFVVASNRRLARAAPELRTRASEGRAASAIRIPGRQLVAADPGDAMAKVVARILEQLAVTVSASRSGLVARGELVFGD